MAIAASAMKAVATADRIGSWIGSYFGFEASQPSFERLAMPELAGYSSNIR